MPFNTPFNKGDKVRATHIVNEGVITRTGTVLGTAVRGAWVGVAVVFDDDPSQKGFAVPVEDLTLIDGDSNPDGAK